MDTRHRANDRSGRADGTPGAAARSVRPRTGRADRVRLEAARGSRAAERGRRTGTVATGRSGGCTDLDQRSTEEVDQLAVGVEREHVRDVLVRPHDHESPLLPVQATQLEDVGGRVGAEDLLVIDEPERSLARQQDRRQVRDGDVAMPLLEHGPHVEHRVGIGTGRGEPGDR